MKSNSSSQYSLQNKHPQYRSAFTYCEDKLPSWMLAKVSSYRGPFTTEQVEDVKTFLRVLAGTTFCSLLIGEAFIVYKHNNKLICLISRRGNIISQCFVAKITSDLQFFCGIVLIPFGIHEFIIYPLIAQILSLGE